MAISLDESDEIRVGKPDVISVDKLLGMNLNIPDYQRPYKWDIQNVNDLILDITNAISDADRYKDFKYRIGTIILHKDKEKDSVFNIVDGQQRIISLVLIKLCLDDKFNCKILDNVFTDKETQYNIHCNYKHIKEWFPKNKEDRKKFNNAFSDILEVVVICVGDVAEAFQLFDSPNTRGKELDPHDLLKAYHLREMKEYRYEMEHAVTKWEAKDTQKIKELFDVYLYRIWNWSRGIKSEDFTNKEIGTFKGISESSPYFYARRANRAAPYYQITEPFVSGSDFFEMVDHYMNLLHDIKTEICTNPKLVEIKRVICTEGEVKKAQMVERINIAKKKSIGTGADKTVEELYEENIAKMLGEVKTAEDLDNVKSSFRSFRSFSNARDLFYCALLYYYDKFHNFDVIAVKKLFIWAFMLCIDMWQYDNKTVNKYAIAQKDKNSKYTNTIKMFSEISLARMHYEISGLQIKVQRNPDEPANQKWNELYNTLKSIMQSEDTEAQNEQ